MSFLRNAALLVLLSGWLVSINAGEAMVPPDLTAGQKRGEGDDWTLGPTGLRGWIFSARGQTVDARQILVTVVDQGSPADGKLAVGDVIVGISGQPFAADARKTFANAITTAEAKSGQLELLCWRAGKQRSVNLKLPVLGSYSGTAPYQCEKSAKLFEQGCAAIAKKGLGGPDISNWLRGVALLASDNPAYRAELKRLAQETVVTKGELPSSWHYGYAMVFLAEYIVATGDKSVLPELEKFALESARGASRVGTWGHTFATATGNAPGYGSMNIAGLGIQLGLVMAREAGVKHPDLDRVIKLSGDFLRWYVNKGSIPYGDHAPWPGHDDNGKNSAAAVLFDLLKDGEAATYFAKMSTAAYSEREGGHCGCYFNVLYAMLGVSRCGPAASGAYWKEQGWYYDLARRWDGNYTYQASPVGEEEYAYAGWDTTGIYTLVYALPRKNLLLTGKQPSVVVPLTASESAEVIAAGRDFHSARSQGYINREAPELMKGLSSWSPTVRLRSAQGLAKVAKGDAAIIATLTTNLKSADRNTQYGACLALKELGSAAASAATTLVPLLDHRDPWLVISAAEALTAVSGQASAPSLMVKLGSPKGDNDPRAMVQRSLSKILFEQGFLTSLDGVARPVLYQAIRAGLANEDGHARSITSEVYEKLSWEDIKILLPAISESVSKLPPTGEMFSESVHLNGIGVLSKYRIDTGIEACMYYAWNQNQWDSQDRMPKVLKNLEAYGTHAKKTLGELKKLAEWCRTELGFPDWAREKKRKAVLAAIARIEAATETPTLLKYSDLVKEAPPGNKSP